MRVVVLSFAVHAVAFALVLRVPRRARDVEPAPFAPIEISEEEEPPPANVTPGETRGASATPSRGAFARASVGSARREEPVGEGPSVGSTAEPGPAPVWSGSFFTLTPNQMGVGRENPFLPSSPPPIASNKPDLGLRFGPSSEGPALAVFKDVTSRSLAPLTGRARFTVRANADGDVLGIDLDDGAGGPGWDDAKRLALEELRGKRFVVPRGARGINVRFEVVSELSYPSGQKKPVEFGARDGAIVLPDESNIGQSPTRKIHTRHLATEVL